MRSIVMLMLVCAVGSAILGVGVWQHMKIRARYSGSTTAKIVDVVVQLNGQCLYTYGFMVAESACSGAYSTRCFSGGFKGMDINVRYIPSDPRRSFATYFSTAVVITWPIYLITIGTIIVVLSIALILCVCVRFRKEHPPAVPECPSSASV